ncbi:MAG: BlaI/MecI/CopY family transcriptional regulator [Acidobacteriota bacterium]|nr:BlaI/MecI/CopY family transcriptional regulator [Acidobacteriota bacterium]
MSARRGSGELEAEVLAALWAADEPLTPEGLRGRLGSELAYTTVTTILSRLHEKGAVGREPHGRGYCYFPLLDQQGLTARRMRALLDGQSDQAGVLSRFVDTLDAATVAALRRALGPRTDRGRG